MCGLHSVATSRNLSSEEHAGVGCGNVLCWLAATVGTDSMMVFMNKICKTNQYPSHVNMHCKLQECMDDIKASKKTRRTLREKKFIMTLATCKDVVVVQKHPSHLVQRESKLSNSLKCKASPIKSDRESGKERKKDRENKTNEKILSCLTVEKNVEH